MRSCDCALSDRALVLASSLNVTAFGAETAGTQNVRRKAGLRMIRSKARTNRRVAPYGRVPASSARLVRTLAYRATRLSIMASMRPCTSATDNAVTFALAVTVAAAFLALAVGALAAKNKGRFAFAARGKAARALARLLAQQ